MKLTAMSKGLTKLPHLEGAMNSYKEVNIFNNSFKHFPEALIKMKNLEILNISANQIDTIPSEIQQIAQLKNIDFGHNQIRTIPETFLI